MNTSLANILVTGGNGQLARAIKHQKPLLHHQFIHCAKPDLDITDKASIENAILKFKPKIIINTAAYTAVDKAESEKELADAVNHMGALNLALACEANNIPLFHVSTDYIFDGKKNTPYLEDDAANPINYYGLTKWLGEEAIRKECQKHYILRVSGVFSGSGNNFYTNMQKLSLLQDKPLRIVADQIICPTPADEIAKSIMTMLRTTQHFGTYHFCGTPFTNWHDFAEVILNKKLEAITTAEYKTAAKRPQYSVLDCEKIKTVFGITQPSWKKAVWELQ